ncbi:CopL family metal-binding regulatory protein [Algicola sagamiensis]|uniref:CopL family metal-binding regulatory protein n=1 Tax=Algicola sagamiensis TaxID=163869 RepID=UPI0012FA28F7|nr:CopL family metal-binding regulatory protein [Algicola sagamiensis]
MRSTICKFIVMTTMLFALLGQTLVYASMSCEMSLHQSMSQHRSISHTSASHASMVMHSEMDYSQIQHNMDTVPSDHEDCCDTECTCPANACISFVFVLSDFVSTPYAISNHKISIALLSQQQQAIQSLYRPPIFA